MSTEGQTQIQQTNQSVKQLQQQHTLTTITAISNNYNASTADHKQIDSLDDPGPQQLQRVWATTTTTAQCVCKKVNKRFIKANKCVNNNKQTNMANTMQLKVPFRPN